MSVDIVHLTFKPPFTSGSYNRMVGAQIEKIREYHQIAVSYWEDCQSNSGLVGNNTILIDGQKLSVQEKVLLHLPERVRGHWFNGITGRESLIYLWGVLKVIPKLKPKLIVCYDGYKMGSLIRRVVDWPCRLILSQRGFSYCLPPGAADRLYSLRSFDSLWVLTPASYRYDRERVSTYEPTVAVLPNGVDTKIYSPVHPSDLKREIRAKWDLPQDKGIVLLLGRLVAKKGAHVILQSWPQILREVPSAFLWIVGGGDPDYERYLMHLVKSLDITDTVKFQGKVQPDLTASCYQASDLYVFPTLCMEGHSLSLLEAMSCGLACVVSDHGSARNLYFNGEVVVVEDPNIEDAFVEPIVRLLQNDDLRTSIGQSARSAVEQRFSQEIAFQRIKEFYQRQINLVIKSE